MAKKKKNDLHGRIKRAADQLNGRLPYKSEEELDNIVLPNSDSAVVILVEKLALGATKDPLISVAICAELDTSVFPNSDSAVVTLVEKLPLRTEILEVIVEILEVIAVTLAEKLPLSAVKFTAVKLPLIKSDPVNK